MVEIQSLFKRQAAWQRSRAKLPWAEKLRQAVVMRESLRSLRRTDRVTDLEKHKKDESAEALDPD